MSSIGNRSSNLSKKGFTFIEVMVSLVILSAGVVAIYKSFFICVDYLSNLSCRLYAFQMLESKIANVARSYRQSLDASFERGDMVENAVINSKQVSFNYTLDLVPVVGLDNVYRLKATLSWNNGRHPMSLSKESLLTKI